MNPVQIGFMHPGKMGVSLAATAQNTGHTSCWASDNRSMQTRTRAEENRLKEVKTLDELCERCSVIVSVCPPHAAQDVAQEVLSCTFKGLYADVNAISPQSAKDIAQMMNSAGVDFVDGGIIGKPAWQPGATWLYLSGGSAGQVAELFSAGPLETEVVGPEIGKASGLKMAFAAFSKGTTALLCASIAQAEALGVRKELEKHWSRQGSERLRENHDRVQKVTAKAWRYIGEMQEIASTFESAGLPGGFHRAAAEVYQSLAKFKTYDVEPDVAELLDALLDPEDV